jgi:hypothetical protein
VVRLAHGLQVGRVEARAALADGYDVVDLVPRVFLAAPHALGVLEQVLGPQLSPLGIVAAARRRRSQFVLALPFL